MRDNTDALDGINYRRWESDIIRIADIREEVGHLTDHDLQILKADKNQDAQKIGG